MKQILLIAVALMLLPSCMVTKCRYGNGIKIEMPSLRRNSDEVKQAKAPGRTAKPSISSKAKSTATGLTTGKDTVELAGIPVQKNQDPAILSVIVSKNTTKKVIFPKLHVDDKASHPGKEDLSKAAHSQKNTSVKRISGFETFFEGVLAFLLILSLSIIGFAIVCLFIPALFEVGAAILLGLLVFFLEGL